MPQTAPGKAHRKGLTLLEVAEMFRHEQSAGGGAVPRHFC